MLTVEDYGEIRRAHRDGMSIRDIARTFGHSRRKVREVLAEAQPKPYTRSKPPPAPVLGAFHAAIDAILDADEQAPRKQRHTAMQVFHRLKEEHGYRGGYDQVRRYVGRKRRDRRETFIPLAHEVLVGQPGLVGGPLAVIHVALADLGAGELLRLAKFLVEGAADLAELVAQRLQLAVQHRADRVGDDVLDDGVWRVVGAGRLPFRLVIGEVDRPLGDLHLYRVAPPAWRPDLRERDVPFAVLLRLRGQVLLGHLELELQESLVDGAKVADFERLVVDEDQGQGPWSSGR
jgi:hypothetical protein